MIQITSFSQKTFDNIAGNIVKHSKLHVMLLKNRRPSLIFVCVYGGGGG